MIDISLLLSQSSYMILNFVLIKKLGLRKAVLLSYLISQYRYHKDNKTLFDKEGFYATRENIEKWCDISEYNQRSMLKELRKDGFLHWVDSGAPMKRYYFLNFNKIIQIFEKT